MNTPPATRDLSRDVDDFIENLRKQGKVHRGFHPPGFSPDTCEACQSEQPAIGKIILQVSVDPDTNSLSIDSDHSYNFDGSPMSWVAFEDHAGTTLSANLGESVIFTQIARYGRIADVLVTYEEVQCHLKLMFHSRVPTAELTNVVNQSIVTLSQSTAIPSAVVIRHL